MVDGILVVDGGVVVLVIKQGAFFEQAFIFGSYPSLEAQDCSTGS